MLVVSGPGHAQDELLIDEELPAASTPTEPPPDTPTRRPTRRPTRPPTATASDTDTPTPLPTDTPADTPTPPPETETATVTTTATHTATVTAVPPSPTRVPTRAAQQATATAPPLPPPTAAETATAPLPLAGRLTAGGEIGLLPLALGALLALCSAWVGARLARGGERRERRRARESLATAMLLELRRVDAVLRRVVALDNPASFPSLEHPIIEAALRDLTLFEPDTAARIAQFHGALRGIQHEIADYRDNPLRWAGRLGELNQLIKARAAAACRAVPDLLAALEKAGGAPPPHLGEPAAAGERSTLPPSPFAGGDDDWTL